MTNIEWTDEVAIGVAHAIISEPRSVGSTGAALTTTRKDRVMANRHAIHARRGAQPRERNNNWKGGRVIASNGYVLIKVGVEHPLADVRGYAYEHRLVATKVLGRALRKGEIVHHRDGDKTNNAPTNLEICESIATHSAEHRTVERGLRKPGAPNPLVDCECGCGSRFAKFDSCNRPRRFVSGHNMKGGRHV